MYFPAHVLFQIFWLLRTFMVFCPTLLCILFVSELKSRDDRIKGYLSLGPQLEDGPSGTMDEFGDNEYQVRSKACISDVLQYK